MGQIFTTVSSKGQLVIPAAIRESLGIGPGARVAVRQEGARVILEPDTPAARLRLVDELCGSTAGGTSMCDMLLEDRRREREMELAKDGW
jgi:AbrB family looped-hinge helix DNA binding protein